MAVFHYKAISNSGEILEGEMEGANKEWVVRQLQAQGHTPIRAQSKIPRSKPETRRLWQIPRSAGAADVQIFTTELATLLQAGLPLDKALEMLEGLAAAGPLQEILTDLYRRIRGGMDLSEALLRWGRHFSPFYINLIRAGEVSGALDKVLGTLAGFLERNRLLRDELSAALVYPVILLVASFFALSVILGVVVPEISQMFADAGQRLPWYTRAVVAVGDTIEQDWWIIAGLLALAAAGLRQFLGSLAGRQRLDAVLLNLPLVGSLIRQLEAARFARSLGTMLENGVPLLEAISISKDIASNSVISLSFNRVAGAIHEGEGLSIPLQREGVLPELAQKLIHVGEESGQLEQMLLKVAQIYEHEVDSGIKRLLAILGPLLILLLAAIIAGIMVSVIIPILNINDLAF